MNNSRYTRDDILQILKDFYNFQSVFDPEVDSGAELTFETTVEDWICICDLVGPRELAISYHKMFNLQAPVEQLTDILKCEESTLAHFCIHIAHNAIRQVIAPVTIMGAGCETAAIFKTLMQNLSKAGVDVNNISPGTRLGTLFNGRDLVRWITEVNKIAPGTLTHFRYKPSSIDEIAGYILLLFLIEIVVVPIIWQLHPVLLLPLGLCIVLSILGRKLKPRELVIGGYNTVRDMILAMQVKMA